jgi:hypothetical protein
MTRSLPPLLPTASAMSAASGRIHLKPRSRSMRTFVSSSSASTCTKVPIIHPQAVRDVSLRLAYNLYRTPLPKTDPLDTSRPVVDDAMVEVADMPMYAASSHFEYETSTRKEFISSPTSHKYDWPADNRHTVQKDSHPPYIPMFDSPLSGIIALQPRLSKRIPFLYAASVTSMDASRSALPTRKQEFRWDF